jgi:ACS family hexuronate transporter-like MFS transporter
MAAWIGGLGFSLVVGALADKVGYGPLFGCLGAFDLIGAAALIILIRKHAQQKIAVTTTV